MSLVNNLQFPHYYCFFDLAKSPPTPSHTNQTYFTLLYKINAQANTLRTLLCQEGDRAGEREGEEKRKKLDTILRAVGFFVVSFCKPKRKRSKRCRSKWWVGEESKENKTKHMKGTFFCFFFFNIIFMLSKILWEIWFLQQITFSLYDLDQIKYIYYNYF